MVWVYIEERSYADNYKQEGSSFVKYSKLPVYWSGFRIDAVIAYNIVSSILQVML